MVEETIIQTALSRKVSQRDLAKRLGISRTTLRKKIRESGITP
jgi:transcriptional regulator with PAS, ATPase and Fis domain